MKLKIGALDIGMNMGLCSATHQSLRFPRNITGE